MYKNFNITEEERQQIMEMHKSHGYKQLLIEQDAATTSIYKGYSGLGTDEDELVKGFSSIKSVDQYKKVESEIAKYGGYTTLQDVLNGELGMDDYDTANKIDKHLSSIPGIQADFSYRLDKPTGNVTFELGSYKITLSAPEVSDDAAPATPGAKEPEKEQPKQTTPISNCAASLSEIKAGSNKILKKGCKTDAVKELQKMLKMDEKHHTGYFGDITKAKVIEFQKNNKDAEGKSLVPDGIVGNKTYEALVKTQTTPNTRGSQTAVQQYFDNRFSTTLPK